MLFLSGVARIANLRTLTTWFKHAAATEGQSR